ncbi:MAG TPA: hypothetical protein VJ973_11130, partial [Christiangramia sp.]|nr:hypothetical protein [Christiangramia sp.]
DYIKKSKKIRFEGDGYGEAWEKEAEKRGLSNNRTTPIALRAQVSQKTKALDKELEVMNETEIEARHEIELEEYAMRIQIEGRILGDIARNHVIPTSIRYQNILIKNVTGLKAIYGEEYTRHAKEQLEIIESISAHIASINSNVNAMIEARKVANKIEDDAEKKAIAYCDDVKPYFEEIRYHCDKLELLVDDELWPLTKYREMLFTK